MPSKRKKIKKFKSPVSREEASTETTLKKDDEDQIIKPNFNSLSKKVKRTKEKKVKTNFEVGKKNDDPDSAVKKPKKRKHEKSNDETTVNKTLETNPHTPNESTEEMSKKKKKKKISMYPPLQPQTENLNEAPDTASPKKKKRLCPPDENYTPGMLSNMFQTKKYGKLILPWDPSFGLDSNLTLLKKTEEMSKLKLNPLFDLSKRQKANSDVGKTQATIFVGNIPSNTTTKQLKNLFKSCGNVRKVKLSNKTKKRANHLDKEITEPNATENIHAYLTLTSAKAVGSALKLNGSIFGGNHIRVTLKEKIGQESKDNSVFVGNLNFAAQDDHLWQTFEKCGEIESVRIVRDGRSGKGKGYGYVNFKSAYSVEAALELNGTELLNRALRVSRHDSKARSLSDSVRVSKHKLKNKKRKPRSVTKTESTANTVDSRDVTSPISKKQKVEEEVQEKQIIKKVKKKQNQLPKS